ncbi:protein adenylyltransferase SelO [Vogesella oryzae]|uniref:protein adenylyltransferase SelO n=1 Tax=Vogesella oryzae TaxID=1735285 RepID=UPI0015824EC4|nr:YdiU family protein [Vogesella oryzae]
MPAIAFDNSYARELPQHATPWQPAVPRAPSLLYWNAPLAASLGLEASAVATETLAAWFSGAELPEGAEPVAQAYAGHQFGGFSPSLGDGRALLLGEVIDRAGQRRDLAFKGSGRTPFSRRGDGKAAVGPMLRELIIGEALHALGIPTTRALAVVATGEEVYRDTTLPGAVLTRVAASHIRVGTFQYFAARGELEQLKALADYTIARHYPAAAAAANPYLALLQGVCTAQARLIAQWMHAGFIHGVMNTDNMTLSGESIDFGPCAFMDGYNPDTVFSSIDSQGRYAYGNQPWIAQWNLARLAEALLPLIAPDDPASAVPAATEVLEGFAGQYLQQWRELGYRKLGLPAHDGPGLLEDWLALLAAQAADHTLAWRYLAAAAAGDGSRLAAQFADPQPLADWLGQWRAQLAASGATPQQTAAALCAANPLYIPRNHLVEEALAAASERGDMAPALQLLAVLAEPFTERDGLARYTQPAPAALMADYRTFCGT